MILARRCRRSPIFPSPRCCRRCWRPSRRARTRCWWRRRGPGRPRSCRSHCWLRRGAGTGRIVMLEPRRLATRAAAARMAALLGETVGATVGYRTRLDSAVRAATRIEVVTDGAAGAPACSPTPGSTASPRSYSTRCTSVRSQPTWRSPSASICSAACARSCGCSRCRPPPRPRASPGCSTRRCWRAPAGRTRSRSATPRAILPAPRRCRAPSPRAVRAALREHPGDVLAFLPGMAEIRRAAGGPGGVRRRGAAVARRPRAGRAGRGTAPGAGRRVVLATAIAETSLTVPGVRIVVDGGFRRAPRLDPARGLTRLATLRISRAAAEQRAGRAGREGPGVAIRLWTEALHRGLPAFDRPEILEAELSGLWPRLRRLGGGAGRPAVSRPAARRRPRGGGGAAGTAGRARRRAHHRRSGGGWPRWAPHPRLAAMMLAAETPGEAALAAELAAMLEERDPLRGRAAADIGAAARRARGRAIRGRSRRAVPHPPRRRPVPPPAAPAPGARGGDPGPLIAAGFPDRIAQRRGEPGQFRLAGGGGARLPPTDPLAAAPLLAVARAGDEGRRASGSAAPLDPGALPPALAAQVTETGGDRFDPVAGAVLARRRRRLGALVLAEHIEPAEPAAARTASLARGRAMDCGHCPRCERRGSCRPASR